jgi:putative transport protein
MRAFFEFLTLNPYSLPFFTVGTAVYVGKYSIKGCGLGMAAAVVVGAALSTWASLCGVPLQLDAFAKSLLWPVTWHLRCSSRDSSRARSRRC